MAEAIGAALAQAGWPVVSGLAEGIDGAAHRGCLARGGRPVAVLGTPIERVYPRHHEELQRQVGQRGLLLSEWPAGGAVQPGHFAARNRLQVALARAVVVVECPESSGALHSARLAWDQGLPIWVVPADAGKRSAMGSNRLLTGMASALIDPRDLIRQLGPGPLATATPLATAVPQATAIPLTAAAEAGFGNAAGDPELLAAVGSGATMEQLSLELDQSAAALASRLLALELSGSLRAMPGLRWQPT
jgi:DNA processing protein